MEEKQRQIDVLKGRRVKRRPILPILANGLAVCEKRATEEVTLTSGHLAATPSALSSIQLTCSIPLPLSIYKNSDPQHLSQHERPSFGPLPVCYSPDANVLVLWQQELLLCACFL